MSKIGGLIVLLILLAGLVTAQTTPSIAGLEVSPDGNFVVGFGNRTIRVWDTVTGNIVVDIPQNHYVNSVSWSPSSDQLATLLDNTYVRVWNIAQAGNVIGAMLGEFEPNQLSYNIPTSISWSPDGQLIAVGGTAIDLWDANIFEFMTQLWNTEVSNILWNPDINRNVFGAYLYYGGAVVNLISPDPNQKPVHACSNCPYTEMIRDARWNPLGTKLAIADDQGRIYVVDTDTQQLASTIQTIDYINMIAWSPDGTQIASVNSNDGLSWEIQICDTTTGGFLGYGPSGSHLVGFDPNNSSIIYVDSVNPQEIKLTPIANAGTDQTISTLNSAASVTLDGSESSDVDGSIVSYIWTDSTGAQVATGVSPTVELPVGVHTLTLTVTDDDGATASDEVVITVIEE